MRTGRFRFVKRKRWLFPPVQVLEVEVRYPADQWCSYYVYEWVPASGSDAATVQNALCGSVRKGCA